MSPHRLHRPSALVVSVAAVIALAPATAAPASAGGGGGSSPSLVGSPLVGALANDRFGSSVALDSSGSVLAVGSPQVEVGVGAKPGEVRVYVESGGAWVQRGVTLEGEAVGDFFGQSVSLSADGSVLAVGAPFNSGVGGANRGHVRVFAWNGTSWTQRGADIDGATDDEQSGGDVDLSADGTRVVIGAKLNGGGGLFAGAARVFEWNGTSWGQLGVAIPGAPGNQLGSSVAISGDGSTVIAGGPAATNGVAKVYRWDGVAWGQRGADIVGAASGDRLGAAVDIDHGGAVIAVGSPRNDQAASDAGAIDVYEFSGGAWGQRGGAILGDAASARFGESLALSSEGTTLVGGAPIASSSTGYATTYRFAGGSWGALGDGLTGSATGDQAGFAVALSSSPLRVAIGAPLHDTPAGDAGQVRVWEYRSLVQGAGAGLPGIALHVAGPVGRAVAGSPVYVAAYKVRPSSPYTLVLRFEGSGAKTTLLQGEVDSRGHLMRRVVLPELGSGSYTVTMRGVHASGTGLQLVALMRVGPAGDIVYLGENTPGIW